MTTAQAIIIAVGLTIGQIAVIILGVNIILGTAKTIKEARKTSIFDGISFLTGVFMTFITPLITFGLSLYKLATL